ncbi:hypothetical protein [Streptosporangium sp. 'caverna']|nr:hypothetical protein [Streptosporangium sp. 'caverna']
MIGTTALAGADPTLLAGRIEALFRLLIEPDTDHEAPTNPTGA